MCVLRIMCFDVVVFCFLWCAWCVGVLWCVVFGASCCVLCVLRFDVVVCVCCGVCVLSRV